MEERKGRDHTTFHQVFVDEDLSPNCIMDWMKAEWEKSGVRGVHSRVDFEYCYGWTTYYFVCSWIHTGYCADARCLKEYYGKERCK